MIRCNANLFRIATACQSREETRFCLQGVYVHPHPVKGVVLVTTDGHRMLVIHDESGGADESAILNLGDALKACKPKRGIRRDVQLWTGENNANISEVFGPEDALEFKPIAVAVNVRIDGTFPDYARVIPPAFKLAPAPVMSGLYLASMGEIGADLAQHFTDWSPRDMSIGKDGMSIGVVDAESPCLVTWPSAPAAFGIIMPIRGEASAALPAWFKAPAPSVAAAA